MFAPMNTEMSRSWSSAHDWKSCIPHKGIESSNLSISATAKALRPNGRKAFCRFPRRFPPLYCRHQQRCYHEKDRAECQYSRPSPAYQNSSSDAHVVSGQNSGLAKNKLLCYCMNNDTKSGVVSRAQNHIICGDVSKWS